MDTRTKRLLIFINPISGDGNAVELYQSIAQPIFKKAGVDVQVIVTKHEKHASEFLENFDLTTVNGVVAMGGDGAYGQIFNFLMHKTMKDAGVDIALNDTWPVKPNVSFGILPAGCGNAMSHMVNSNADLETAVLSIILGRTTSSDIGVVKALDSSYVGYTLFFGVEAGFGKAYNLIEKLRMFKKLRLWFILPAMLWLYKQFDVEISYKTNTESENTEHVWQTFKGKAMGLYFIHSYMRNNFNWKKNRPYTRPVTTSGKFHLVIDKMNSLYDLMFYGSKFFMGMRNDYDARKDLPEEVCEQLETTEFKVKWNSTNPKEDGVQLDGEPSAGVLAYHAKIFKNRLDIFVIDHDIVEPVLSVHGFSDFGGADSIN